MATEQTDEEICNRLKRGWLLPYLETLDRIFSNRWHYWLRTAEKGEVMDEPIPKIKWLTMPDKETMKNLDDCIRICNNRSGWDAFNIFVEWLLFGFGDTGIKELPAGLESQIHAGWYKTFNLGLFLKNPFDYFGQYAAEFYGSGKSNSTAYFPTPMNVSIIIAEMITSEKDKGASVYDPCVGSGRLLMAASNYSLNLYGMDIDYHILNVCKLNMWMYVPWAVFRPNWIKGIYPAESIKRGDSLAVEEPISKTNPEIQQELLKYIQPDLFEG